MFTGIITDVVPVLETKEEKGGLTVTFKKPEGWDDLELGESIATNGTCLTVTNIRDDSYDCHLMPESLAVSSFGSNIPKQVNLERSLSAKDRFGGHFVQGHVDSVGTVSKINQTDGYYISIEFPAGNEDLVIYKGSITINGVSLTVTEIKANTLTVALIPHTLQHTTLDTLKAGDKVNLEFDMIGKYVAKIMEHKV